MEKKAVGFEIRSLNNHIKRYMILTRPPELDEFTLVHGWAIRFFYENLNKDIFQKDFENFFSIRRPTATKILQLMEKNELIIRSGVDYDKRLKKITLTDKAVKLYGIILENIDKIEKKMIDGIEEDELIAFFQTLDKIKSNMEVKK